MKAKIKVLLGAAAVLVGIRAALPSVITARVNASLSRVPGWEARVSDVDLALLRGAVVVQGIKAESKESTIRVTVARVSVNISWSDLLRRRLVASVDVLRPRATLALHRAEKADAKEAEGKAKKEVASWPDLSQVFPFRLDSFKLRDGEIEVSEGQLKTEIKDLYFTVRGLTNVSKDAPARGEASASLPKGGTAKVDFHLEPGLSPPSFGLAISVKKVDLASLNPLLLAQFGMDVDKGVFELVSEIESSGGGFRGYMKPFVSDLKMGPTGGKRKGVGKVIKEAVIGAVAVVLKNRKTDSVAAKVPFEGRYDNPEIGVWEAIASVLRNAFVKALAPTFE